MSVPFTRQRVRIALDVSKSSAQIDVMTGTTPHIWRGTDVVFELGAFWGDANDSTSDVLDVSNIASITLQIKTTRTAVSDFANETVSSPSINTALTKTDWLAGTDYHAACALLNTETAPTMGSDNTVTYFGVVSVITNDSPAREITWGIFDLVIEEDGHGTYTSTPVGDPSYYTMAQTDAAIIAAKFNTLRLYNQTTGNYCHIQVMGAVGEQTLVFGNETT